MAKEGNISIFTLNTTSGKSVVITNKSVEEIASELHLTFPNWSDEVCLKMANNSNFYHEPYVPKKVETEKDKKAKKKAKKVYDTSFKTPYIVGGITINPLLKLGSSICAYHRNGYRQWGVCINEVFDDWKITPVYHGFENMFEEFCKELFENSIDEPTKQNRVSSLCGNLIVLRDRVNASGVLNEEGEYIKGCGRRLGLQDLISRIDLVVSKLQ